jgi:hypothetical protein
VGIVEENKLYESRMEDLTLEKLQNLAPIWRKSEMNVKKKFPKKRRDKKYLVYREDWNAKRSPGNLDLSKVYIFCSGQ